MELNLRVLKNKPFVVFTLAQTTLLGCLYDCVQVYLWFWRASLITSGGDSEGQVRKKSFRSFKIVEPSNKKKLLIAFGALPHDVLMPFSVTYSCGTRLTWICGEE